MQRRKVLRGVVVTALILEVEDRLVELVTWQVF